MISPIGANDTLPLAEDAATLPLAIGQVFTPTRVADFMAILLFPRVGSTPVKLLDAGAGDGALSRAAIARIAQTSTPSPAIKLTVVEQDSTMLTSLRKLKTDNVASHDLHVSIHMDDFISLATRGELGRFSHVIANPPYARLPSGSDQATKLRAQGVHVPNLYAAFIWLSLDLLEQDGTMVFIVPRSFCNGPRFRMLRNRLFVDSRIEHIHSFESRSRVFGLGSVLQETVIMKIRKTTRPHKVSLSWSTAGDDVNLVKPIAVNATRLIGTADEEFVIRIPRSSSSSDIQNATKIGMRRLISSPLTVSTGSVVDFRHSAALVQAESDGVPLIDSHFSGLATGTSRKKPQRYVGRSGEGQRFIFPRGNYVVVKRISPKEQTPRIRAAVVRADEDMGEGGVAFENHLNVIHRDGAGMSLKQAAEIVKALSSKSIEQQFVERSGSTQVNASDLRAFLVP